MCDIWPFQLLISIVTKSGGDVRNWFFFWGFSICSWSVFHVHGYHIPGFASIPSFQSILETLMKFLSWIDFVGQYPGRDSGWQCWIFCHHKVQSNCAVALYECSWLIVTCFFAFWTQILDQYQWLLCFIFPISRIFEVALKVDFSAWCFQG